VALDPLWPSEATVGGVVSANDSGALRLRYGGLRDLVLGMTIVLADGTVARTGGKVVKNVAGYDLPKLLTGAEGTLAIIAEVTFRLHAIPRQRESFTVVSRDAPSLGRLTASLLTSTLSLETLQVRTIAGGFALDCELASTPEVLAAQATRLAEYADGLRVSVASSAVWQTREAVLAEPDRVAFKATGSQTGVVPLLAAVRQVGGEAVGQAHGILFGSLPSTLAAAEIDRLRSLAASFTLLAPAMPDGWSRHGALPSAFAVMQAIKQRFDPGRILNAGRFLGGL
jgi:glycolate oxidase FAD binding subunit